MKTEVSNEVINIRWTGGEYKVSIPDWEGGYVVTVEAHKSVVARQQSRIQELEKALRHWLDMRVTYIHGSPVIDANNKAERIAIENAISAYKGLKSKL